jgi:glycosyltransferase involved in cell wall biosynthesis
VSVVIPVFNEKDNLAPLVAELTGVLRSEDLEHEVVIVDDGSTDGSVVTLRTLEETCPELVVIELAKNYGQSAAIAAGLAHARGRDVVLMDGDGQNDPGDIPAMLARRREGYDLVAGWRVERKDRWISRRLPSLIANRLIWLTTGLPVHDHGCTLKVVDGNIARSLRLYGEMHRFIPVLAHDLGARVTEMPVKHRARVRGVSKYGMSRTVRVLLDLLTVKFLSGFSTRPIHIFGGIGLAAGFIGFTIVGVLGTQKLLFGTELADRPLLLLGILLSVMGVQFVTTGLLAEMLARTYHESQDKPIYRIRRIGRGKI